MKPISKKLRFDDRFLDKRIPDACRILNDFDSDYPIFLAEGFLSKDVCDRMAAALRATAPLGKAAIGVVGSDGYSPRLKPKERDTDVLMPGPLDLMPYIDAFRRIAPKIESFFRIKLIRGEGPFALGYSKGCHYRLHADNCSVELDWLGRVKKWVLTKPDRIISTICFLSEAVERVTEANQCVGGDVSFDYLRDENNKPLRLKTRKGLLAAFPSTPYFSHRVFKVKGGYRISLVDWHKAELLKPTVL